MKFFYDKFWVPVFGYVLSKFVFLIEGKKQESKNKQKKVIKLKIRIDSKKELEYLTNGGILPYVFKQICNEENIQNYENLWYISSVVLCLTLLIKNV